MKKRLRKTILYPVILVVLLGAVVAVPALAADAMATRTVPVSVESGAEFDVTIAPSACGAFGQVEETLPDGFRYISCTPETIGVESSGDTVTFTFLGSESFTYTVQAPRLAEDTEYTFQGIVKDENRNPYAMADSVITVNAYQVNGTRTLASQAAAGASIDVSITAAGCGTFGQVLETLPEGLSYVTSSLPDNQVEQQAGNLVKFTFLEDSISFNYTVTAPVAAHPTSYTFHGIIRDEDRVSTRIEDDTITIGGDLSTAIAATNPGGTLQLVSGDYAGNVEINKPLTITGTTGTVINGGITVQELTGSNVIIEGLTVTDYTDFGIRIVKVKDTDSFSLRDNTFQGVSGSVTGVEVDNVASDGELTIERNTITDNDIGIKLLAEVAGAIIKYNDISGNTLGLELLGGGAADASRNWWGHISGPKHTVSNPRGEGDGISGDADYQPWLTRQYATALNDNIAYFGSASVNVSVGWNIISTPVALDSCADTLGEFVAMGDPDLHLHETSPIYRYDTQTGTFAIVTDSYPLSPLDAIYVRMAEADIAPIIYSPDTSVPVKEIYPGWNLIGLANLNDMPVDDALSSIYKVAGDLTGYTQVVSPLIGNQEAWIYVRDAVSPPDMLATRGYWIFMLNAPDSTDIAGFVFTPLSLD
jgi:hypothetical protein